MINKERLNVIATLVAGKISTFYHDSPIYAYCDLSRFDASNPNEMVVCWSCVGTHDFGDEKFRSGFESFCTRDGLKSWKVVDWGVPIGNITDEKESRTWLNSIRVRLVDDWQTNEVKLIG